MRITTTEEYAQRMADLGIDRGAFRDDREFADSPAKTPVSQRLKPPGMPPKKRMGSQALAKYRDYKRELKARKDGRTKAKPTHTTHGAQQQEVI